MILTAVVTFSLLVRPVNKGVSNAPVMPTAFLEKNASPIILAEIITNPTMEVLFSASLAPVCLWFLPLFSDFKGTAN
jgi:hypothetical protein